MEQKISRITLGVADPDSAAAFYRLLGWGETGDVIEGAKFFQLGSIVLVLVPQPALSREQGRPDFRPGSGGGLMLSLDVKTREDVTKTWNAFIEAGGTSLREPFEAEGGDGEFSAVVADLDGYTWEITWSPGLKVDATGNLVLG